jgi:hypothetical protein
MLGCGPLEHEVEPFEPRKPVLPGVDLAFKDGTRIRLIVKDRQRPIDIVDTTIANDAWCLMPAKVAEYSDDTE